MEVLGIALIFIMSWCVGTAIGWFILGPLIWWLGVKLGIIKEY